MKASHLAYATRAVPRYTSYPTAPHFSAAIGAEQADAWLRALAPGTPLSLYVHVPFCRDICLYCGCHTKAVRRLDPLVSYADLLLREIDLAADRIEARLPVRRIHWGGGTPSLMPAAERAAILERLARRFDLSTLDEMAMEIDPRTVSADLARDLAALGVSRASLGVQDFAPHVQRAIGRVQPPEAVESACARLRAAGIENIAFDLMYGLPDQSRDDAARSAEIAMGLDPARVASFGYAHVPWMKTHQKMIDAARLPGAAERHAQAEASAAVFLAAGLEPIGLDHFARPDDSLARARDAGALRRNFQGYTDDDAPALLAFGASAIGRLPQGFVQNAPDLGGYGRAVAAGVLPTTRGVALDDDDRLRADAIERVMCDFAVDVDAICARRGAPPGALSSAFDDLAPLARDGLVAIDGARVSVKEEGRPFVRIAAAAFDAYLPRGAARHSAAV